MPEQPCVQLERLLWCGCDLTRRTRPCRDLQRNSRCGTTVTAHASSVMYERWMRRAEPFRPRAS